MVLEYAKKRLRTSSMADVLTYVVETFSLHLALITYLAAPTTAAQRIRGYIAPS